MESPLTDRQLRFVFEYLQDQNASAAAVRAGYSEKTRASQASDLMKIPAVRERIRVELESLLAELRCSALALMKERMRAAFFRAEKMFGAGWEMLPLEEMEPETRAALQVSAVLRKSGPVIRMRQPDRDRALRALEKVHERLEKLNEQYYAQLERAGAVPSLEEIEAMDAGGEPGSADDFSKITQVLSGSGAGRDAAAANFSDKTQVLSGWAGAGPGGSEGWRVPAGAGGRAAWPGADWPPRPQASPWLLRGAVQGGIGAGARVCAA